MFEIFMESATLEGRTPMSELRFGDVERLSKNETEARFRPLGDGSNRASSHESDFSPALSDGFLLVPELDAFPIYAVRALSERSGREKPDPNVRARSSHARYLLRGRWRWRWETVQLAASYRRATAQWTLTCGVSFVLSANLRASSSSQPLK